MDLDTALSFAKERRNGVLVTHKRDGRPQLSNITYLVTDEGTVQISVTSGRAKFANLTRDPRASLYVGREDFWAYAVIEADVEITPPAKEPNDATVEALIDLYRKVAGEHPDWDDYRRAMVDDGRVVLTLTPTHAYGML